MMRKEGNEMMRKEGKEMMRSGPRRTAAAAAASSNCRLSADTSAAR